MAQGKYDNLPTNINIINRSQEFLLNLVQDILDYSKHKQGKLQLNKNEFPLKDLTDDLSRLFAIQMRLKNIDLRFSLEELSAHNNPRIYTDYKRLK